MDYTLYTRPETFLLILIMFVKIKESHFLGDTLYRGWTAANERSAEIVTVFANHLI